MSEYGLQYLTQAKAAYSFGNIKSAKDLADQAIGLLQNKEEYLYEYFDGITLLQSIAANQRDYDGYQALEPLIKDCTYRMFHDLAPSYYALHQYDASEFYGNLGLLADAAILIKEANTFLMDTYGEDLLLKLMYHHYDAKLSYRLEERSPNLGLLHIATHGIYPTPDTSFFPYKMNGRKRCSNYIMEECGLLLAEDYLLTADEISMLPLTYVNLCVLSACDSGLGSIENYEGSFGIRRAFFLAGCKSLLVCLWKINDLSSMLFFSCFYHELAQEDVSSLEALNRAKQILRNRTVAEWKPYLAHIQKNYNFTDLDHAFKDVLNQHDSYIPFKHPYYWAGFILIGSATKPDHILHR